MDFFIALLTLIPNTPMWLDYVSLIALLIAVFMAKGSLGIQWNNQGSQGAYFILLAILLHVYDSIGDNTLTAIAALLGLILYLVGLGKLKANLDADGAKGASRLKIAVILGIVAVVFGWIPLLGGIIAGIFADNWFHFRVLRIRLNETVGFIRSRWSERSWLFA